MRRILLDFPPTPGAAPVRRTFREPIQVVRATAVGEVLPALRRVERGVREGLSAAGYLTYEAAPAFDPAFRVRGGGRMPLLWFGLFEGAGKPAPSPLPDGARGAGPRVPGDPGAAAVSDRLSVSDSGRGPGLDPASEPGPWELEVSRAAYDEHIAHIRRAIEAGETYQVNYTARMRARVPDRGLPTTDIELPGDGSTGERSRPAPRALYDRLRASQGGGYHALLELEDHTVVSASPELFFQIRGREVTARPMKGTGPRGRWLEEDDLLARGLRDSEKEQAENRMIVDLLRNDLGRVAEIGSVEVPRVFDVERYRTVFQMTSTITARVPAGSGFVDVLGALFPCGSVTGAPKIRTMGIIADLETSPREVYCGAIGFVEGGSGSATFNVPIRTLWIDRERGVATYGVGGGVTWDSTAEGEYDELKEKARVLHEVWPDFDLLETLRLEDGRYRRLERHVGRMRSSAEYFDRDFPEERVREVLEDEALQRPDGAWKVRITVSEAGRVAVTVEPVPDVARAPEDTSAGIRKVVLAARPVDSRDRFLFHKTTHRVAYDSRRAEHPGAYDVLLHNERGEITEFTTGNAVFEIGGRRVTPPRSAGLLAGCYREQLLETDAVEEETVSRDDVARAQRAWLVNSVRGWVQVTVVAPERRGTSDPRASSESRASSEAEAP